MDKKLSASTRSIFNAFTNDELYQKLPLNEDVENGVEESLFHDKTTPKNVVTKNEKNLHQPLPLLKKPQIKRQTKKRPTLTILDTLISLFLVSPLVVGFWATTWTLVDVVYPKYFPIWQTFWLSVGIHVILAVKQDSIHSMLTEHEGSTTLNVFFKFVRRVYFYFFALVGVVHWRSGWLFFDYLTGVKLNAKFLPIFETITPGISFFVMVFFCICLIKTVNCLISVPFTIALDKKEFAYTFPTYFRAKASDRTSLYILDCLFSVIIVGTLVVFVWRGAWVILDTFIFPNDDKISAWTSLAIGYGVVVIIFMIQPLMRKLCDNLHGALRLLVSDIFLIVSIFGSINLWRGVWNLLNIYFLPGNLELSCWIVHWVCLIMLILLGCSNTLLVRGVYIDAEEPAGKCVVFPCHYLRIIFHEERLKKLRAKKQSDNFEKRKQQLDNSTPFTIETNHVITNIGNIQESLEQNHKKLIINP